MGSSSLSLIFLTDLMEEERTHADKDSKSLAPLPIPTLSSSTCHGHNRTKREDCSELANADDIPLVQMGLFNAGPSRMLIQFQQRSQLMSR